MLTCRQPLRVPKIGGYDCAREVQGKLEAFFELRQRWRREMTQSLESFHFTISATHWDNRYDRRAALDGIFDGTHRPRDRFVDGNVGCAEENEDAEIDAVLSEKVRRLIESLEIEPFVEVRGRDRMNRLESDSDFETSGDLSRERKRAGANGVGVRLDGDSRERRGQSRDSGKILRRNRSLIEEIAGVVDLESIRHRTIKRLKNGLQLIGQ